MKRGPFPMRPAFPTPEYYDPLRLPLDHPMPLPGFAGYRPGIASLAPQAIGVETALPSSQDDRSHVQRPYTPEGSSAPAPGTRTHSMAFAVIEPARLPLPRPKTGPLDDAYSGFTRVADRAVDPTPLRTRPLDHARGHHYRGPRRLPGPDSHRQAALNLSPLRHVDLPFFMAPRQSRRTRALQGRGASALLSAETRETAHLPCLAGEQGSELTGADVLTVDELEGCEIGE